MARMAPLVIAATLLTLASCKGKEAAPPPPDAAAQARADSLARVRAESDAVKGQLATMVNFAFDRFAIRPGADRAAMEQKVAILKANPNARIQITGHCDERGPSAYNMALGQRRADAAKRFLTGQGIAADRVTTASRGEEQPLDPGHTREAWAKNRRVEFAVTAGGDALRRP